MIIYTAQEVAEILSINVGIVKKYIREGKIKKITGMGVTRVTKEELDKFIKGE